jgi:leucyl aminopeptidase
MEKLGMGAILGVARGSAEEPQFIIMEYFGAAKSQKPIVYVGKGVTFDTGGINLKPSHGFDEMHMDMAGGAAVISAVCAIARLGCKLNVVGIVPAVENMPSGSSYRPGDILRSMSGKTIEIRNTDAEGRVILSDALTYSERYHPSLVVDIATLTGACMVALGDHAFAVLSPSDELAEKIKLLGEVSGDYCWPLPLWEEYEHDVRGTIGDVSNAAKNHPRGGTINAACFLQEFSKAFPKWAHLDIASTMTSVPSQYLAPGATGTGTRILIEIARSR